jgi:hypothetical protein
LGGFKGLSNLTLNPLNPPNPSSCCLPFDESLITLADEDLAMVSW